MTACVSVLLLLAGCDSESMVEPVADASFAVVAAPTYAVTPTSVNLKVGEYFQFHPLLTNGSRTKVTDVTSWTSSNPAVLTVTSTGLVKGQGNGTATVTATSTARGVSTAIVYVGTAAHALSTNNPSTTATSRPELSTIYVNRAATSVAAGETMLVSGGSKDQYGVRVIGVKYAWSSGNPAIATVSATGVVKGISAGQVTIRATSGGISGSTTVTVSSPTVVPTPAPSGAGIWLSQAEIATLPTSGSGWNNVKSAADTDLSGGNLGIRDSHNTRVMAAAMVAARLNSNTYRAKVRDALNSLMNTTYPTDDGLAILRRLGTYAIAADLIGLKSFDPTTDARFRGWLDTARKTTYSGGGGGTLASYHERRSNNWGQHAAASRMAVTLYLGETAEFARAVTVFRGWLGERSVYASFQWGSDLSWQADPSRPVGINPKGATKDGHNIDGVVPDDQRRCGSFAWPACKENYAYEALQGAVAAAWIAHRQGYQVFEWSDRALLRAFVWLHEQADFPAIDDDKWQPWIINSVYGTSFPASVGPAGKNVGFTEWTHAK